MQPDRSMVMEDEDAYLDMQFRRALLRSMSPKKRLRLLKAWAEEVAFIPVQPISGARPSAGCIRRANEKLKHQLPVLIRE